MHGWKTVSLGDVCIIEKTKYKDGELPYVGMEDIVSSKGKFVGSREPKKVGSSTFQFTPEHLLYGRLRPYLNKVLLPDFEGHCSTEIFPLLPKAELDKSFLFYWITSEQVVKEINHTCTGARMPRANVNEVLKFDIPIPPIYEQKRIVAIIDEAFAGIDTAIANTEKNLANARELFESYLGSVFTRDVEGWEKTTLGEAYDVRDGTHDSPKYQPEGRALVTSKNLKRDGLNFEKIKYISEDDYISISRRSEVHKGDVLFAMIGTIGNPIVVEVEPDFAIKNVALFKVAGDRSGHFLKYYLGSRIVIDKMMSEAKGTTQKFVGLGYLRQFPISIPELDVEAEIVKLLTDFENEINRLESIYQQKINSLNELKQSLLQKAFSGELTAEGDKLMDEAVA